MRVYVDCEYEDRGWVLTPEEDASDHLKRYRRIFEVDDAIVARHKAACAELEEIDTVIEEAWSQEGEVGPLHDFPPNRLLPQVSVYQLRRDELDRNKTGVVIVALSVPTGASWSWEPGRYPPDGRLQWWAKHMGDEDFSPHGGAFQYEK